MPRGDRTQPLQERSSGALGNLSDQYYRAGNVEGMRRMNQQLQNNLQNHPSHRPGTGGIFNTSPMEGGPIDPKSFWNVQAPQQTEDNSGVMAAMANNPMVQQAKGFYEQIDPWIPIIDFGERKLGFDFERPILGGTLGYGMDYDWDDENIGAYAKYMIGLGG